MGKDRIDDVIRIGYNSRHCTKPSAFEVELSKLITACTLMPTMNIGFDFEKFDDQLKLQFYPTGRTGHDISECTIDLDKNLLRTYQLCATANRVRNHMQIEGLLTQEDNLSKNDDILWSALDDTAMRVKLIPSERDAVIRRVSDMSLKINALRKMLNAKHNGQMSEYESVLTTILGCMDYFTNSNHPDNELSRLSVNEKSYFNYLDSFEYVNRAIRDNCLVGRDMSLNDYICARNPMADNKASYLAGLYLGEYNRNSLFNTRNLIVSNADFLDTAPASEM